MFYQYDQNNSDGYFETNEKISYVVIIEADDSYSADSIAEGLGIYFDGVEEGIDCECCGDRWSRADEGISDIGAVMDSWTYSAGFVHFKDGSIATLKQGDV